ncbi:MAG: hypothetical protein XD95_0202 [Microgenomates bacterium 39_7]|nr:MAG: hypothetical protein XD95_0202 [Microgenomates bacterium 39_7]
MKPSNLPRITTARPSNKPIQPPSARVTQSTLNRSIDQRRRLKAAEYSSKDPVQTNVKTRGEILERRIAQLQQENRNK